MSAQIRLAGEAVGAVGTNKRTVVKVLRSSAATSIVTGLAGVLVLPRIVHGLTLELYGEWATIAAFIAIGQLVQAGAGVEIARRVAAAVGKGDTSAVLRTTREGLTVLGILALGVVSLTAITARPLVALVFKPVSATAQGQLALILFVVMALFGLALTAGAFSSALSGLQRGDYGTWGTAAGTIGSAFAILVGLHAGLGLWSLVVGNAVQVGANLFGLFIGVRSHLPSLLPLPVRPTRRLFISFVGMPAMVIMASASDLFDSQIDKLVLTHNAGPSAAAMFQIGAGLITPVRSLILIPLAFLLAGTAELHLSQPERLRFLERLADTSVQCAAAVVSGGLILFCSPFIAVWLGHGYGDAALSVRLLAVATAINAWSAPWAYYALGRGHYHYVLISAGVTLALNLSCTIALTSTIGIVGALIGSIAGAAGGLLAGLVMLRRWDQRRWLATGLRSWLAVSLIVVPGVALGLSPSNSWSSLFVYTVGYLLVATSLLQLVGASPLRLTRCGRRLNVRLAS